MYTDSILFHSVIVLALITRIYFFYFFCDKAILIYISTYCNLDNAKDIKFAIKCTKEYNSYSVNGPSRYLFSGVDIVFINKTVATTKKILSFVAIVLSYKFL